MDGEAIDTGLLGELTEQSQDLNSDALRLTRGALADYAEERQEARAAQRRSRGWGLDSGARPGTWAAGLFGVGAALIGTTRTAHAATATSTASASASGMTGMASGTGSASGGANSTDVMALQTAASIENLAVQVYTTASGLSFIQSENATVKKFISTTIDQHKAHAEAFNAALTKAGAQTQTGVDPKYAATFQSAAPNIKGPGDVITLALQLEDAAAQTYTKYVSEVSTATLRTLFGSIAPVEAQHRTVLLTVQSLLNSNNAALATIPTQVAKLPADIGSVGIPVAFYPTTNASPTDEGAVQ